MSVSWLEPTSAHLQEGVKVWLEADRRYSAPQKSSPPNLLLLKQLQPCHMLLISFIKPKLMVSEWFETHFYLPSFQWMDNLLAPTPWTVAQLNSEANCLNPLNTFPCIHLEIVITPVPKKSSPFQVMPVLGCLSPDHRTALLPSVPPWDVLMF